MVATRSKTKPNRLAEPAVPQPKAAEVDPKAVAGAIWAMLVPTAPLAVSIATALGFVSGGTQLATAAIETAPAWAKDPRPRAQTFRQPFIFQDVERSLCAPGQIGVRVLCEDTRVFEGFAADRTEAVGEAMRLAREAGAI